MHITKQFIKQFKDVYGTEFFKSKLKQFNETMITFPNMEQCCFRYIHGKHKGSIVYPDNERTGEFIKFLNDNQFTITDQYTHTMNQKKVYVIEFNKDKKR